MGEQVLQRKNSFRKGVQSTNQIIALKFDPQLFPQNKRKKKRKRKVIRPSQKNGNGDPFNQDFEMQWFLVSWL